MKTNVMPRHKFVIPVEVLSRLKGKNSIAKFMEELENDSFNEKFKEYRVTQDDTETLNNHDVLPVAEPKRELLNRISWLFGVCRKNILSDGK